MLKHLNTHHMIIGVDASKAAVRSRTGVENAVYEIILALKKIDKKNIYFLYTDKKLPEELTDTFNFIEKLIPFPKFWNKIRLPLSLFFNCPNCYLAPAYMIPRFAPEKSAAIIHDLAWVKFPEAYTSWQLWLNKKAIESYDKRAKKVFCVSKSAETDLLNFCPNLAGRTEVVYLAASTNMHTIEKPADVLKLNSPYFLSLGRLEERKNTARTVLAFYRAKKESQLPHKLVLAGKAGFGFDKIKKAIESDTEFSKDVVIPGHVEQSEINELISGAEALVYPSLYEGFGMPALEAMSCGIPVITSNTSSIPEVVGGAAILVDPEDTSSIARAMIKIVSNKDFKEKLIKEGFDQAKQFSWEKTAWMILEGLEAM